MLLRIKGSRSNNSGVEEEKEGKIIRHLNIKESELLVKQGSKNDKVARNTCFHDKRRFYEKTAMSRLLVDRCHYSCFIISV